MVVTQVTLWKDVSAAGIEGNAGRQKESEGGICILELYKWKLSLLSVYLL